MTISDLTFAVLSLPEPQRVALAHQAILGVADPSLGLSMRLLARTAQITADALTREAFLRDCG